MLDQRTGVIVTGMAALVSAGAGAAVVVIGTAVGAVVVVGGCGRCLSRNRCAGLLDRPAVCTSGR
jgi:hypothetical protein